MDLFDFKNRANLMATDEIGLFKLNKVYQGDCQDLITHLPNESLDVVVTSPPYWGQRLSQGVGVEDDPRVYLEGISNIFTMLLPKLKPSGILWINIGDSYNTPVNWRQEDHEYSSLGAAKNGLNPNNSAYTKPRAKRKAFIDKTNEEKWLRYGNLPGLTYRLVINLCDQGFFFRGEVIWSKRNPMPEGRCRRPHRHHEPIYLFARSEDHNFRVSPVVKSVWEISNEKIEGTSHFSRYPLELPKRCIEAYGKTGRDVVVFDPFSGSGTTGLAALQLGCSYIGFEIDDLQVKASNARLKGVLRNESVTTSRKGGRVRQQLVSQIRC